MIYLDNSSTTRQYDEVTRLMCETMADSFGNPSSLHRLGMNAEKLVKEGRRRVAGALSVKPEEVFFTSCGTESDNTALFGAARARKRTGKKIITTRVEHPAILEACARLEKEGFEVEYLPVDGRCMVDMDALKAALTEDTIIVSVMAVNNETGTIMPLSEIGNAIKEYNKEHGSRILFHSDMVQAFGKVRPDMRLIDLASVSAHKIHGPKGMGALYIKEGLNIEPFFYGGGQEKHFRSGTENVPGIAGFGLAAEMVNRGFAERTERMRTLRSFLLERIKTEISDIKVNGFEDGDFACPAVLNVSFLGTRGEVILHTLEQDGIYVSTGSACASNHKSKAGSHVLRAMGLNDKEVEGAIRFSFSEFNTMEEMNMVAESLVKAVGKFRKLGSFR